MRPLVELLESYKEGRASLEEVLSFLKHFPSEDLDFARVDHHRTLRRGYPEVVYGEGKSAEQILTILRAMGRHGGPLLATRVSPEKAERVQKDLPGLRYDATARMLYRKEPREPQPAGPIRSVQVLCAGSSDLPVAEEAAITAEVLGRHVERFYDVGVAGLHRLLSLRRQLDRATAYVVVAGMEGALPSVVAGLVARPVIAVPTSVGYGASFGGIAALLGMLNSCAPGVAVVNIDNGFGAGYLASMIADMADEAPQDKTRPHGPGHGGCHGKGIQA
ncbi:hypothetical protein SAMN02746041_02903 [Desulfacinum hydrothermale DSM 13146]|uniref:PurE domain-containing protein n=1 Tax=Desulfacinum hydrothermale DSM 13146 TaxID=1121390 RepID=A0A1W1XTM9_9BACT|nr:nickel pincer cofactor biosynthesis protein LarB [Desulfacinum hydrothermale]SMC27212.1 hypothetical protein SAMN02746041_02903 [Desulfacinum hydrothermale DSM 13146]